ncbi:MAG: cysteine desulfurase [Planctomycetota bacterium]|jgi:cysteine desulfurase
MKRVHLDHNATTSLRPEAREALMECLDQLAGNPSSVHASGRAARAMLDDARERVAGALGILEDEVIFTSGGTESDNLALQGAMRGAQPGARLVTTAIEHSAVLEPAAALEGAGCSVLRAPVDAQGRVDASYLLEVAPGAALLSVMAANNEVGSCVDLEQLSAGLRERCGTDRPLLHTDAVQALGKLPVDLAAWGVDLASFSAHKVGGPLGCGVLVRRMGTNLAPVLYGGGQEADLRPGTENVPAIVAGARAIELAVEEQAGYAVQAQEQVTELWAQLEATIGGISLLGPTLGDSLRLPNTLNISIDGADGLALVARLDLEGLEASSGSACASGSLEPSHVLLAMGLDRDRARAGLRLSIGRTTTAEDIHIAVDIMRRTITDARKS